MLNIVSTSIFIKKHPYNNITLTLININKIAFGDKIEKEITKLVCV